MSQSKILVVDDEVSLLTDIKDYFEDYNLITCSNPREAQEELKENFYDIIIVDYKMPEMSGVELLLEAKKTESYYYGILLTAYADKEILEEALNNKIVSKFIEKPVKLRNLKKIIDEVNKECELKRKEKENLLKYDEIVKKQTLIDTNIIGLDKGLKYVFQQVDNVAKHPVSILITGETGTGKELISRLVHQMSNRRDNSFIEVNCAAIPENLLESELFGYAKGAFTGAAGDKPGKIELAHNGTLFLDEIGDMRLDLQAKLLRVLQDKKIQRLGSIKSKDIDFRLVAATNKDLPSMVQKKEFRDDLFYRISTFPIPLPSLKERKEDIPDLVTFYIDRYCKEIKVKPPALDLELTKALQEYKWPGNIRELMNAVQRALIISSGKETLALQDFSFLFLTLPKSGNRYEEAINLIRDSIIEEKISLKQIESDLLASVLSFYEDNVAAAVKNTGITKDKFYRNKKQS